MKTNIPLWYLLTQSDQTPSQRWHFWWFREPDLFLAVVRVICPMSYLVLMLGLQYCQTLLDTTMKKELNGEIVSGRYTDHLLSLEIRSLWSLIWDHIKNKVSFDKNGLPMGVAFSGLNNWNTDIYIYFSMHNINNRVKIVDYSVE